MSGVQASEQIKPPNSVANRVKNMVMSEKVSIFCAVISYCKKGTLKSRQQKENSHGYAPSSQNEFERFDYKILSFHNNLINIKLK